MRSFFSRRCGKRSRSTDQDGHADQARVEEKGQEKAKHNSRLNGNYDDMNADNRANVVLIAVRFDWLINVQSLMTPSLESFLFLGSDLSQSDGMSVRMCKHHASSIGQWNC